MEECSAGSFSQGVLVMFYLRKEKSYFQGLIVRLEAVDTVKNYRHRGTETWREVKQGRAGRVSDSLGEQGQ